MYETYGEYDENRMQRVEQPQPEDIGERLEIINELKEALFEKAIEHKLREEKVMEGLKNGERGCGCEERRSKDDESEEEKRSRESGSEEDRAHKAESARRSEKEVLERNQRREPLVSEDVLVESHATVHSELFAALRRRKRGEETVIGDADSDTESD